MVENKNFASRARVFVIYAIVFFLGIICLLPLWNIVAISLSSSAAVTANKVGLMPIDFTSAAYKKIVDDAQFWRSFGISVFRVVISLALNLLLIILMAYPLTKSKDEFKLRNIYMNMLIFAMLFSGGMIPSFILMRNLNLLNSVWSLILPGAVPIFSVIMVMNFFLGIPKSLEEAAAIDGAKPLAILFRIMVPCAKPSLATVALFSIVGSWNDFFSGLIYIQKPVNYPIMTYIQSLNIDMQELLKQAQTLTSSQLQSLTEVSNKNLNAAKIVVAVIPLLLIYPILQKYLISGLVMGAVKE